MTRVGIFAGVFLMSAGMAFAQTSPTGTGADTGSTTKATVQQTANPELVGKLARALNATPTQAEGAAGSLFAAAKQRMQPTDWTQVARVVPGMSSLLTAAPAGAVGTSGNVGSIANAVGLGGVASELSGVAMVASAFEKLGLDPTLAAQAVPVVTQYVQQKGGGRVAQMLKSALK